MVNEFAGRCRCDLCSEGTAVAVKSAGVWQYWCIDCCVWQLPDMTRLNIHAAEHSFDGNHSTSPLSFRIFDVSNQVPEGASS